MMIKINFTDFWNNFKKHDNYFYHLLNSKYDVVIDEENPDLLFFSLFGSSKERYATHRCKKIFYCGENAKPNFDTPGHINSRQYRIYKSDFAIGSNYLDVDDSRYCRFPFWSLWIDWFKTGNDSTRDPSCLIPIENLLNRNHAVKSKFCGFLYSRDAGKRCHILDVIQQYKPVDCAGKVRHNTDYWVEGRGDEIQKVEFVSTCKFTIAAENSKHDGYSTEKISHPMSVGSIPIYWGSDRIAEDFNEKAFINANKLSDEELLEAVIKIDNDDDLYTAMINEPVFPNGEIPYSATPDSVLKFIEDNILCSM